jgi:hypothetical protein
VVYNTGNIFNIYLFIYYALPMLHDKQYQLRGNFFKCHVFTMKSVQNLKSFWRSSQNYFVLALFSSL